jgi:RNA polymerase sigma-70 factor (ECF subfamily)
MILERNRPLLEAFRRGERAALTTVYTHYVDEVALLVRQGFTVSAAQVAVPGERDPQRQRDLVQETFLRAFSERARLAYDGLSPFRPWLLRIAKNLMIDEGRRAGRMVLEPPSADALDAAAVLDASPEEALAWKTLRAATIAWRAAIEPELQRFVQLRFEEERSQAEVAALLAVTRRRVRTLETEVRVGLRVHLRKLGLTEL